MSLDEPEAPVVDPKSADWWINVFTLVAQLLKATGVLHKDEKTKPNKPTGDPVKDFS